jgi:hypothetical protein
MEQFQQEQALHLPVLLEKKRNLVLCPQMCQDHIKKGALDMWLHEENE